MAGYVRARGEGTDLGHSGDLDSWLSERERRTVSPRGDQPFGQVGQVRARGERNLHRDVDSLRRGLREREGRTEIR
jgi:hypothetical protein